MFVLAKDDVDLVDLPAGVAVISSSKIWESLVGTSRSSAGSCTEISSSADSG